MKSIIRRFYIFNPPNINKDTKSISSFNLLKTLPLFFLRIYHQQHLWLIPSNKFLLLKQSNVIFCQEFPTLSRPFHDQMFNLYLYILFSTRFSSSISSSLQFSSSDDRLVLFDFLSINSSSSNFDSSALTLANASRNLNSRCVRLSFYLLELESYCLLFLHCSHQSPYTF